MKLCALGIAHPEPAGFAPAPIVKQAAQALS